MTKEIILASTSFIRKKILQDLNINFTVIAPIFDEEKSKEKIAHLNIYDQVNFLAKNKALSISKKYPNAMVIGSDQICELGGEIISKSKDREDAINQLIKLNNKKHIQNNSIFIYQNSSIIASHYEIAKLKMKNLTQQEIINYVDQDQSWGSAGSYKFEENGYKLFEEIEGRKNCILGFAIDSLLQKSPKLDKISRK
ncbi:Maf family nucleotide pyrophosphatase [Rickettsiales bacterium]|nr:Maf family nucleotide pyrophosphatase [Rickettsiales bacterium]MDB2550556.1 Maf family nucleotide pyrophosphatase [Rickettsiales bacterium]